MNKKKINDTSTPILKSSQSNTDNLASNDLNIKKRKADVLSNNDETGLSNSSISISSAQSTDNVGFTNSIFVLWCFLKYFVILKVTIRRMNQKFRQTLKNLNPPAKHQTSYLYKYHSKKELKDDDDSEIS